MEFNGRASSRLWNRNGFVNGGGMAQVFWVSDSDDPVILLEATDSYLETITLSAGGIYIGITGNDFTGHLEMNIE